MNAFGFFKRLLGQSPNVATDPLAELGLDPSSTDEFLRRLVRSQVWIMSQGKAMETESPTPEEALEHIRRGAQRLAAVDSADQIQIYIHEIDNEPILPFFSSADLMQAFVQTLLIDRITNFEGVSVPFAYLLNAEFTKNHFVLNIRTRARRYVSVAERKRLLELATV